MTHRRMRSLSAVVLVVTTALVAACAAGGSGTVRTGLAVNSQELTGNELLYGASPHNDGTVVYQPGVVFLGGGASSVRSVSSDGLVWTVDGNAAGASRLAPGAVVFASSLGAGRV